jgi:radical SAM superfamily enzyme YgiQ (UPF0313 family)
MRVTLIHPCIGRRAAVRKPIRTWQLEPLWAAALAGATPADVELRFHDDRLEPIPFDRPTDLVGISAETYTARRAYQIASEYRQRGVPVVIGGFHATLCPEDAAEFAEAVVVGPGQEVWPRILDDARRGRLQSLYRDDGPGPMAGLRYPRGLFEGKRYLPLRLVEFGRGCQQTCEFCAVQSASGRTYRHRPVEDVLAEVAALKDSGRGAGLLFFVDDNLASDPETLKEFLRRLIPLRVHWVGQASISSAHDPEMLELMVRSGCRCVLIGFESLEPEALRQMHKPINEAHGGVPEAVRALRRHGVPVYGTFVFGWDSDTPEGCRRTARFAVEQGFLLAAFAQLLPFPGTPLYQRLAGEGRLRHRRWWRDDDYGGYNTVAYEPRCMSADDLRRECLAARHAFFSWRSLARRSLEPSQRRDLAGWRDYWAVNLLHRTELGLRDGHPLGDVSWRGPWLRVG